MLLRGEKDMNAEQVTLHGDGKAEERPRTFASFIVNLKQHLTK
jgi:hypothetical protein